MTTRRTFMTVAAASVLAFGAAPLAGADSVDSDVASILDGINDYRATQGAGPLTLLDESSAVAQSWSDHLAATGAFEHSNTYSSDERIPSGWTAAGEVIAKRSDTDAAAFVQQWIDSPTHEAIISDPQFTRIGIGVSEGGGDTVGVANLFAYPTAADSGSVAQDSTSPAPEVTNDAAPDWFADFRAWLTARFSAL
ncbi:CAP domain-containing protein [Microbacteriaceae bacterium VKM Ac-2854]|nr:CAP domain-containing protein [Microbacteriaceae bacterium VKM Ac-2854]